LSADGFAPLDVGTLTPSSGSSVRGVARLKAAAKSGAAASRAVSAGNPQRNCTVFRIEV
jgi:hypothetical protein